MAHGRRARSSPRCIRCRRAQRTPGGVSPVDANIVEEETPYEILDGRLLYVAGARPPHAVRHTEVVYVLRANVAPGYTSALDLLTRVAHDSNIAPDASIYPDGDDPATQGRRLEELVVEVTGKQSFSVVTRKAARLSTRGVRRVFCVRVKRREVMEWDHAASVWTALDRESYITDRCLVRPLAVRSLLDAAAADDEAVRGLIARGNPVLREALREASAEGERAGRAEGERAGRALALAEALLLMLAARGVAVSDAARATLLACDDPATLTRWMARAASASTVDEVLA